MPNEYWLGANDGELKRLEQQHRVWRDIILQCWRDAGITAGKRVLDLGAGPGFATVDLAEIVGPSGEVVAIEREPHFVHALEETIRAKGLSHVRVLQLDLERDALPSENFDFVWCRLVAFFIQDCAKLVRKISGTLAPNGVAIFHEIARQDTWQFSPPLPQQQKFVRHVLLQNSGGNHGVALRLARLLKENGFALRSTKPHIFCVRSNDPMWEWTTGFLGNTESSGGQIRPIEARFIEELRQQIAQLSTNPNALMLTPLLLEIVAKKD